MVISIWPNTRYPQTHHRQPSILYAQPSGTASNNPQCAPPPPKLRAKPPFYPEQRRFWTPHNEVLEPATIKLGKHQPAQKFTPSCTPSQPTHHDHLKYLKPPHHCMLPPARTPHFCGAVGPATGMGLRENTCILSSLLRYLLLAQPRITK
jgi:hypothetical protein